MEAPLDCWHDITIASLYGDLKAVFPPSATAVHWATIAQDPKVTATYGSPTSRARESVDGNRWPAHEGRLQSFRNGCCHR